MQIADYCKVELLIRKAAAMWLLTLALVASKPLLADYFGVEPSREEIQQEMKLVKMLLDNSPLSGRTAQNKEEHLIQPMELARTLYGRAVDAYNEGNMVWADVFLGEALSVIEDAVHLSSDPLQVETKQREQYAEQMDDVRAFDATYQNVRKGLPPKDATKYDAAIEPTYSLINRAQKLVGDGKYTEGSELLKKVHAIYVSVLNELLASKSFVYDHVFNTPAEEFEYEMARYHSYEELIPIAIDQLKPDENLIKLSERFVQDALKAHVTAEKQAADGNQTTAIKTLQDATKRLQTALRTLGLNAPE